MLKATLMLFGLRIKTPCCITDLRIENNFPKIPLPKFYDILKLAPKTAICLLVGDNAGIILATC